MSNRLNGSGNAGTVARRWTTNFPRSGNRSYGRYAEVLLTVFFFVTAAVIVLIVALTTPRHAVAACTTASRQVMLGEAVTCNDNLDSCCVASCCDEGCSPGTLFDDGCCDLQLGGWISGGFTQNAHGNHASDGNVPLPYNFAADAPVLNQCWLYAEKPLDTESGGVDWGFRVDYVYGTDALGMQAYGDQGWDYGWNTSQTYGSAIPQLYAEVGNADLSVLVGYFLTIKGYEYNASKENFFYSHNYGFGYGTPNAHAGFLASYAMSEQWQIDAGWTMGWDSWWSNYLGAATFVGGATWSPSDDTYLSYHVTAGHFGDGTAKDGAEGYAGQLYSHVIVLGHSFWLRWSYVLEHTLGSNTGLGTKNSQWYSLANYLFYDINDCLSAGARLDWYRDEDGQWVGANGAGPGSYCEATLGLNWQPHPNLRLRPELRWDWFNGQGRPFDSRDGGQTGTATTQLTGGLDLVFTF